MSLVVALAVNESLTFHFYLLLCGYTLCWLSQNLCSFLEQLSEMIDIFGRLLRLLLEKVPNL